MRTSSAPDPIVGSTIDGRYAVVQRLGAGGMGVVYLAEHLLIGKRFALKLMRPADGMTDELLDRFQREAVAAASVGNPHIVDVSDMGMCTDGTAFLVMEYLNGRDLAKAVAAEGPFSISRAVHVTRQLCEALYAVHEKRIVHRDLKPENIMLVEHAGDPDFVKVLDFGICKLLGNAPNDDGGAVTSTNASLGTPQYMAPEQFRGSARVDKRADIHAVGAILFFLLTGAAPYEGDDLPLLLMRVCTEAPPSARMLRPDVPRELDDVIKRACAKRPEDRYEDCTALSAALRPFADLVTAPRSSRVRPIGSPLSSGHGTQIGPGASAPPPPASASGIEPSGARQRPAHLRILLWGALAAAGVGSVALSQSALSIAKTAKPPVQTPPLPQPDQAPSGRAGEPGQAARTAAQAPLPEGVEPDEPVRMTAAKARARIHSTRAGAGVDALMDASAHRERPGPPAEPANDSQHDVPSAQPVPTSARTPEAIDIERYRYPARGLHNVY